MDNVESDTSITKKPSEKPTNQQKCMLLELIVGNDVLKITNSEERLEKWQYIANLLNTMKGAVRTAAQWKNTWMTLRRRAKEGKPNYLKNLSEEAQKLLISLATEWDCPTDEQKCQLLELMATNKVLEMPNTQKRWQKWQSIAEQLNGMKGPKKTVRQWKNSWGNIKARSKNRIPKYLTNISENARKMLTSDATEVDIPTDEQINKLLELLIAHEVHKIHNSKQRWQKWQLITEQLNSMEGVVKTTRQWINIWTHTREKAKRGLPKYLTNISESARELLLEDPWDNKNSEISIIEPEPPTNEQKCMLLELMAANDVFKMSRGRDCLQKWESITQELNSMTGVFRRTRQWKTIWWNIKRRTATNGLPYYLKDISKGARRLLVDDLSTSEAAERDFLAIDVTLDDCCESGDKTVSGLHTDDYCRQLIRAVSTGIRDNKNVEEVLSGLCKNPQPNCKKRRIWTELKTFTEKKLQYLLKVSDRGQLLPPERRMTLLNWLLFDTVLIHLDVDVIGISDSTEKSILRDLFNLVVEHNVESLTGDELADTWSMITLKYNKDDRQCTPMLLQRRWYQMKFATRARYCKFWSLYKNSRVPPDCVHQPTQLEKDIAMWHKSLLVEPFMMWEDLIKNNRVILREQFELIALNRRSQANKKNTDPTPILTIDLDEDETETNIDKDNQPSTSTATNAILNTTVHETNEEFVEPVLPIITNIYGNVTTENLTELYKPKKLNDNSNIENAPTIAISPFKENTMTVIPNVEVTAEISNALGEVPDDTHFAGKGVRLLNDGSTLHEEIPKEFEVKVETHLTEEQVPKNEDISENTTFTEDEQLEKLLQVPIVYTVKLDDMGILPISLLQHVNNKGIIDIINFKSKPTLKRLNKKQITTKSDDKTIVENSDVKTVVKRVKLSSPLFQKPRYCTYPDKKLSKNPDFNINILFHSVIGKYFSKRCNNVLYRNCKPLTVDLSKEFEKELVNGTVYLDTTEDEGVSSTCAENNVVKPDVRYVNVYRKLNNKTRKHKVTPLVPVCPANRSDISKKLDPITNAFKPITLNNVSSNNLNVINTKYNTPTNILSDVDNSYISESLPSLEAVGSLLSILNDDGNDNIPTVESPNIACSSNQVLNISNMGDTNMSNESKPTTYQTSDVKECYTDEEINAVLKRALMTLNIDSQNPISSYVSGDLNTELQTNNEADKDVVEDYPKTNDQDSIANSTKDDNTDHLVDDILKKAVDNDLLQDSTFQQTSLKLNAELLLDIQKNSSSSNADIEELVLPFMLKKPDETRNKVYPRASKSTNKIQKTNNQNSGEPQRSGKMNVSNRKPDEKPLNKQQQLKSKDSLYSYIGSKPLQKAKETQKKDTTFCCWASQRLNDIKTKRNTVPRHKCPYQNCTCCCRDLITEFKYLSEKLNSTGGSTENDVTRSQLDNSVTIKQEPGIESNLASNVYVPSVTASFSSAYTQTETFNITPKNTVSEPLEVKIKQETITENIEINKSNAECTFSHNNLIDKIIQKEYLPSGSKPSKSQLRAKRKPFTSMFVGKNNVLLTTVKLPPNLVKFEEFMYKLKQTFDLPKYIQLKLLPTGRVTLYRHPDFQVSEELLEKLTQFVDEFYQDSGVVERITTHQSNQTSIKENLAGVGEISSKTVGDHLANAADNFTSGCLRKSQIHQNPADSSAISQEQTTETPCEQDKIDVYTAYNIQSSLGHIFNKVLTPVTNMTELKYAYSNKGLFFKFNLKTNKLQPMNICIKRKSNKETFMNLAKPKEFSSDNLSDFPPQLSLRDILMKKVMRKGILDLASTANEQVEPFNLNIFKSTHSDAIDSQETIKRKYDQIASSSVSGNSSGEPLPKIKVRKDIQNIEIINASKLTSIVQEFVRDQDKSDTNIVLSGNVQDNSLVTEKNNSAVSDNVIYVLTNVLLTSQSLDKTNNCTVIDDEKQTESSRNNVASNDHADGELLNKSTTINVALNTSLSGERLNENNVNNILPTTQNSLRNEQQNTNIKSRLTFEDEPQNENEATMVPSDDLLESKSNSNVSNCPDSKTQNESKQAFDETQKDNISNVSKENLRSHKENTNNDPSDASLDGETHIKSKTLPEDLFDTDAQMESYIDNASSDGSVDCDLLYKSDTNSVSAEDLNCGDPKKTNNTRKGIPNTLIDSESKLNHISSKSLLDSEQQSKIINSNVSSKDFFDKKSQNNENIVSSDKVRDDLEQNIGNENTVSLDVNVQKSGNANIISSETVLADNIQNSHELTLSSNDVPKDLGQNNNSENISVVDNVSDKNVHNNSNEKIASSHDIHDDHVQNNSRLNNIPLDHCLNSDSQNERDNTNIVSVHKSFDNKSIKKSKANNSSSSDGSKNETNINASSSLNLLDSESQNNSNTINVLPVASLSNETQNKNNTTGNLFENIPNKELQNKTHTDNVSSSDLLAKELQGKNNTKSCKSDRLSDKKLQYKCTVDLITLDDLIGKQNAPKNSKENNILPDFFNDEMPNNRSNIEKQNKNTNNVAHEEKQNKSKNNTVSDYVPQSKKQNKGIKSNVKPKELHKRKTSVLYESDDEPLVNIKKRMKPTSKLNEAQLTKKVGYIEITHHHPIEVTICISSESDSEDKEDKVSNEKKVNRKKKLTKSKKKSEVDLPPSKHENTKRNKNKHKQD